MSQDISEAILWLVISLAQIAQVVDIFNNFIAIKLSAYDESWFYFEMSIDFK